LMIWLISSALICAIVSPASLRQQRADPKPLRR
jgi:hypothetical protein